MGPTTRLARIFQCEAEEKVGEMTEEEDTVVDMVVKTVEEHTVDLKVATDSLQCICRCDTASHRVLIQ